MSRWLLVLFALFAQVATLVSPMLLRHCESADGQHCLEVAGQDCGCHNDACSDFEHDHDGCHDHDHDGCTSHSESFVVDFNEPDEQALSLTARSGCDCKHSLIEILQCQSQRCSELLQCLCLLASNDAPAWSIVESTFLIKARQVEMRSDPDAHLAVIAAVALRV